MLRALKTGWILIYYILYYDILYVYLYNCMYIYILIYIYIDVIIIDGSVMDQDWMEPSTGAAVGAERHTVCSRRSSDTWHDLVSTAILAIQIRSDVAQTPPRCN